MKLSWRRRYRYRFPEELQQGGEDNRRDQEGLTPGASFKKGRLSGKSTG